MEDITFLPVKRVTIIILGAVQPYTTLACWSVALSEIMAILLGDFQVRTRKWWL